MIGRVRSSARDALAPVQSVVHGVTEPVGNFFSSITHYGSLKAENSRLKRQLEVAEGERLRNADAPRERAALLALAQLTFAADIPTVAARVVSTAPSNFQLTIGVGRGTTAGVERGMPVGTALGLVAAVLAASPRDAPGRIVSIVTTPRVKTPIVVLAVLVVHTTLLTSFRFDGVTPDAMLLLTVVAGIAAGPTLGAVMGFACGLGIDLFLQTPLGLSA